MSDFHFASVQEAVADELGDELAIVQGDTRLTHRQFDDRSARFATALEAVGVSAGAKVSLYLYNSPEYLVAHWGAFKHGCCPINVNYRYLDEELAYLVDNSDSEVLVFHTSLGDRVARVGGQLANVKAFVAVDDGGEVVDGSLDFDEFVASHDPQPRHAHDPTDSYMLYTGGTTGMPKGVMYEHEGFIDRLYQPFRAAGTPGVPDGMSAVATFARFVRTHAPIVSVPCCPLMHGTGMWVGAMPALITGGTVVMLTERSFDAAELLALVEREQVTRLAIVGDAFARPILRAIEAAGPALPDVSSVKAMISSGAMWSAETKAGLLETFPDTRLIDALGSTEGGSYGVVEAGKAAASETAAGTTAKFALGPNAIVVTESGEPLASASGQTGLLASATAARGYYKDPDKTARTFTEIDGTWYVITGDWATQEADGSITLHGRGSNCINTGGEKVYPEEVEEAVKTHGGVDDCYVIGIEDERFGQRVVAVVGASELPPTEDDLRAHLRGHLAGYKIPKQFVVVEAVQRAPNGKADYPWARELIEGRLNHPA
ncbi:MAG TPA: AMP-binding protein [Acidimicrobiales bacterium]|nr:AMP-binding protein [Acidimicrobiales bacterium]